MSNPPSLSSSDRPRVAFQGEPGAWSEVALFELFDRKAETKPMRAFSTVFEALENGDADAAVLPVENSTTGSVIQVVDGLFDAQVYVVGEVVLAIDHALLAPPDVSLDEIGRVISHPQALDQCAAFLREQGIEPVPAHDTAGAAARLADEPAGTGALAAEQAAELHGLEVLARDVADQVNRTRFFRLEPEIREPARADKTSLGFVTEHEPGALLRCLTCFADEDVNLLKLESRPVPNKPWHYRFLVDLEAALGDEATQRALKELEDHVEEARVFGTYPSADPIRR